MPSSTTRNSSLASKRNLRGSNRDVTTKLVEPSLLDCGNCAPGLAELMDQAREKGAQYMLLGYFHKMSTLVGWVKFAVFDLATNDPACDRFLTYRGDTDEAWFRASRMMVRDIVRNCLPQSSEK